MAFTEAQLDAAEQGVDWAGGCGRESCPCQRRGHPCSSWMGLTSPGERPMPFCPRCGWSRRWHPEDNEGELLDDEREDLSRIAELLVIGSRRFDGFRLRPVETAEPRDGLL